MGNVDLLSPGRGGVWEHVPPVLKIFQTSTLLRLHLVASRGSLKWLWRYCFMQIFVLFSVTLHTSFHSHT